MASILKRFSHGLRTASVVALLTAGTYVVAQEYRGDHPDTYVVKRGDTLWDIAGKFLRRPWLWPEIWQANPQIKNPHLIYPGDVISLAYLDRIGITPGPRIDAPIGAVSLAEIEPYLKDMRVVDRFKDLPYVVGIEEDYVRSTAGQKVYVKGLDSAQVGQRFAVVRPTNDYRRINERTCCDMPLKNDMDYRGSGLRGFGAPWSEAASADSGESLGYELLRVNAGSLMKLPEGDVEASTVLLDDPNTEARVGDRLIPVDAQPYDLQFFPHPPKQALDADKARVLAVASSSLSAGTHEVVAISAGSADGIDNGTVVSLWRQGSNEVDRVAYGPHRGEETVGRGARTRLPDEYASHAMVFRTFDKVSYALVMESAKQTMIGYRAKHPDTK
ncbi:MAG: LysM peptidoglycan-binding domain-containing protein [Xanthomonadaceae bacterium]|nr:LysM peptidoglycan-binding domain-containing protein [Xanthomonadaceae bacterium]